METALTAIKGKLAAAKKTRDVLNMVHRHPESETGEFLLSFRSAARLHSENMSQNKIELGVVTHTFNPSTQEAGGSL